MLSRQRIRVRLPGLAGPQRVAAGLLVSVVAMVAAPMVPLAPTPLVPAALAHPVDPEPERPPPRAEPGPAAETERRSGAADARGRARRRPVEPGRALLRRGPGLAADRPGQSEPPHRRARPAAGRVAARRPRGRDGAGGEGRAVGHRAPGRDPVVDRGAGARLRRPVARPVPGQPDPAGRSRPAGGRHGAGHPRPGRAGEGRAGRTAGRAGDREQADTHTRTGGEARARRRTPPTQPTPQPSRGVDALRRPSAADRPRRRARRTRATRRPAMWSPWWRSAPCSPPVCSRAWPGGGRCSCRPGPEVAASPPRRRPPCRWPRRCSASSVR